MNIPPEETDDFLIRVPVVHGSRDNIVGEFVFEQSSEIANLLFHAHDKNNISIQPTFEWDPSEHSHVCVMEVIVEESNT